jgi:hypothetical protein
MRILDHVDIATQGSAHKERFMQILHDRMATVRLAWGAVMEGREAMRSYENLVAKGLPPRVATDKVAEKFFGPKAH